MAVNNTAQPAGLITQLQTYFSKQLLERQIQLLQMEQFAEKVPYPTKSGGNKTIRFFRFDNPSISNIVSLTDGTTPATGERDLTLSTVEATLEFWGQSIVLSDQLLAVELYNHVAQATKQLGEDAALFADTLCHRSLVLDTTAATASTSVSTNSYARYAQNGTNGTTFATSSAANSSLTVIDLLDGATALKVNRAPKLRDGYVLVAPPQLTRDLMNDDDFLRVSSYSKPDAIYKGEVGRFFGINCIETTNALSFGTAAPGVATNSTATGSVFASLLLGGQAFGVPHLTSIAANGSPFAPKVTVLDAPDKSDRYGQRTIVSFKSAFTAKALNQAFYRVIFSKSNYS
ncbi:MAG: N4-gp56 family major capsid protein [Caulobacteraceae bacterium]|nr:N4-gp56 family major capsid protein [Caulobacteraceae bacterium]